MPTLSITTKKEEAILAALSRDAHASRVARALGDVSYATVWRVAARAGIDLTAGRAAKGYKRLPAERRAKVEDAVRAIPERRRTSSRARPVSAARPSAVWCVRAARLWRRPDDAHFRKPELEPGRAGLFHRRYGDTCDVIELQPGDREVIIASGLAPGAAEDLYVSKIEALRNASPALPLADAGSAPAAPQKKKHGGRQLVFRF